jgi:hypothetical protein
MMLSEKPVPTFGIMLWVLSLGHRARPRDFAAVDFAMTEHHILARDSNRPSFIGA